MYISLCLNPSIDNAVYLDELRRDANNRCSGGYLTAGGKGINIARALRVYGAQCKVFGFSGGFFGELLEGELERDDIDFEFVRISANTRMNIKLIEKSEGNRFTEINTEGGPITEQELTALVENLLEMLKNTPQGDKNYLFLSGSCPRGVDKSIYNYLIGEAKKLNFKCVVDCDKSALEYAVQAAPYIIKPNNVELELLAKRKFSTADEMKDYCLALFNRLGTRVLCTKGSIGSFYVGPEGVIDGKAVPVEQKNPVGAGDVSLASFVFELDRSGGDVNKSLRLAMAAGAAMAETEGGNMPSLERIEELLNH